MILLRAFRAGHVGEEVAGIQEQADIVEVKIRLQFRQSRNLPRHHEPGRAGERFGGWMG